MRSQSDDEISRFDWLSSWMPTIHRCRVLPSDNQFETLFQPKFRKFNVFWSGLHSVRRSDSGKFSIVMVKNTFFTVYKSTYRVILRSNNQKLIKSTMVKYF